MLLLSRAAPLRLKLARLIQQVTATAPQIVQIDPNTGVGTPNASTVAAILDHAWTKNDITCKEAIPEMRKRKWVPQAIRTPLIGMKMGMMHIYDHWGRQLPITVVKVDNVVVQCETKNVSSSGLIRIQIGMGNKVLWKKLSKSVFHHFLNQGVKPKKKLKGFWITRDSALPVGWQVDVRHFQPGSYVDVQGISIGKGFQGAMKLHGFSGLPRTHGVSLKHRSLGSTGQNQSPGRVFKGKRMHGRMGNKTTSVRNLYVYKVDPARKLLFLVGSVPGYAGNWIRIRDPVLKRWCTDVPPPFPTFIPPDGETPEDLAKMDLLAPVDKRGDPFLIQ